MQARKCHVCSNDSPNIDWKKCRKEYRSKQGNRSYNKKEEAITSQKNPGYLLNIRMRHSR